MDTLVFNKIYFYRFPRIFVQNFPIQFYPGRPYYSLYSSCEHTLLYWSYFIALYDFTDCYIIAVQNRDPGSVATYILSPARGRNHGNYLTF